MRIQINTEWMELPGECTAKELAEKLNLKAPHEAVSVEINGILQDLDYQLNDQDKVKFLSFEDPKGKEVFWHSSAHVLAQAILRLFPEAKPTIGPPIENGFYYDFANVTITEEDFERIEHEV
jgi:threonyl-tRNA synthetase